MLLPTLATALGLIPLALTAAVQIPSTSAASSAYPITNQGNHRARDPNIIHYNNEYYLFQTGSGIAYSKASELSGPWTSVGEVLDGKPSVIDKGNRYDPWAPTVIQHNNEFYCFYSVSTIGSRNSSIGVATSATLAPGSWTDHGALINTVSGQYSNISPYTVSNAIDPSVIVEVIGGQAYLTFGSYWTDIWQVPLTADLLSVQNPQQPNAKHLSLTTPTSQSDSERPEEASWISYKAPYYYLWFSKGFCCGLDINNLPPAGQEYSIRVGRSSSVTGPYLDKNNTDLLNGGGEVVYGSNSNGQVYAPGSSGVLTNYWGRDVLYYHYLNQSIGLANDDAFLGYNYLDYEGGWPVVTTTSGEENYVQLSHTNAAGDISSQHLYLSIFTWGLWTILKKFL